LEFELANNGVVMKFTATEVAKGIKEDEAKLFNMDIPEGFQEASMDDLKNMGM